MRDAEGEVKVWERAVDQGYGPSRQGNSLCKIVEAKRNRAGAESVRRSVVNREAEEDFDCSYLEGMTVWGTQGVGWREVSPRDESRLGRTAA